MLRQNIYASLIYGKRHQKLKQKFYFGVKMDLQQIIVPMIALLVLVMQFVILIKVAQIQNNQKHKPSGHHSAVNGQKHGNNPNKKHGNNPNQNQNNNRPTQQNQAKPNNHQQKDGEKKFEKIGSNAQSLKETNTQLAQRPRPQQGNKPKVYSERTDGKTSSDANTANDNTQKQERPANTPIKQQELPKSEEKAQGNMQAANAQTIEIKAETIAEVKNEQANSVQYGRR
jgi:cytoskeletal protein RodZ